jgi:hypothetical protein
MRRLLSSLLVGALWMPIHIYLFSEGRVFVFLFVLLILSYSVVIYTLAQDTGFSVLLATIFHLSIILTNLHIIDAIYETTCMMIIGII